MLLQKESRKVAARTPVANSCQVQEKDNLRRVHFDSKRNHEDYDNALVLVISGPLLSFPKLPKTYREGVKESPQHFKTSDLCKVLFQNFWQGGSKNKRCPDMTLPPSSFPEIPTDRTQ